jgi:putative Holliday junction resolvase
LLLSGERGEAAFAAESFAARLAERTAIPVETYDERLTSALGERLLRESGTRRKRDKGQLDQSAAVMLLDSFLRRLANLRREEP